MQVTWPAAGHRPKNPDRFGAMRYNPALDGLRALAAFAVVCFHARVPGVAGGWVGVDLFFVLSGYLITTVLMENPNLGRFYWRRAKRLIPPLAFMLAAYLAVAPFMAPGYSHASDAAAAFVYLGDYWPRMHYIGHTWSLAVEEHFYLLWPLVLLRLHPSVRALVVAYIMATLWRYGAGTWQETFFRFDTRLAALIVGCILARVRLPEIPAWPGLAVLAGACIILPPSMSAIASVPLELAAAVAIVGRHPRWLSRLAYLGKLSYGIYLWHYPIVVFLRDAGYSWPVMVSLTLVGSIALAALSYHTIEAIFRSKGVIRARSDFEQPSLRANGKVLAPGNDNTGHIRR